MGFSLQWRQLVAEPYTAGVRHKTMPLYALCTKYKYIVSNNFNSSWICSVLFIYISCEKRQQEFETCVHCFRVGLTVLHHGGIYHSSCGRVPSLPQVGFTLLRKYESTQVLHLGIQS
jgi:hypothetical protein